MNENKPDLKNNNSISDEDELFLSVRWNKVFPKLVKIKTEWEIPGNSRYNFKELPSVEYLNECFSYDENTGNLIRNIRPPYHFESKRTERHINSRDAGTIAGVLTEAGYFRSRVGGSKYMNHRIIWKMMTGEEPISEIDHINNVRSDNRWCNLRLADHEQNARNCIKSCVNDSGFKGVHWDKTKLTWVAQIGFKNKRIALGYFPTKELGFEIYKKACDFMFEEFKNYGESDE